MVGWMRLVHKAKERGASWNRKCIDTLDTIKYKKIFGSQEWFQEDRCEDDSWELQEPKVKKAQNNRFGSQRDNRQIVSGLHPAYTRK